MPRQSGLYKSYLLSLPVAVTIATLFVVAEPHLNDYVVLPLFLLLTFVAAAGISLLSIKRGWWE